jgi:NAD(P)-dependent dehydrogenase (short-subunit alcohol dehydrogenase family)
MASDGKVDWRVALGVGALAGGAAGALLTSLLQNDDSSSSASPPPQPLSRLSEARMLPVATGSVCLVTGASPGTMGGSICEALAALGCDVAAVEHPLRKAQCEGLCRSLRQRFGVRAAALTADATDAAQVEATFVAAAAQLGVEPTIVIATVGGGGVAPGGGLRNGGTNVDGTPRTELSHEESWETTLRILSVTQFSTHYCCKAAARHMIAGARGGSIIIIGSVMAEFSHPSSSAYTSSKCAIKKLGEIMSRELAPHGERIDQGACASSLRAQRCSQLVLIRPCLAAMRHGAMHAAALHRRHPREHRAARAHCHSQRESGDG